MERQEVIYYRQQLKEYLRSTKYYRNADEQKVQKFVEAIENDLLEVIRTNQHVDLQDVYEFIDKEALGELINLTNRGRSLAAQNEQSEGLLREAMDYYLGYLESNKHPLSEKEIKRRKKNPKPEQPEPESYDKLEGRKYEGLCETSTKINVL